MIPTLAQLQPLYDAAVIYHAASDVERAKYKELAAALGGVYPDSYDAARKHADLKPLTEDQNKKYRRMMKLLGEINAQFPGLDLFSPAPYSGGINSYADAVRSRCQGFVIGAWEVENEAALTECRAKLEKAKVVSPTEMKLGDLIFSTVDGARLLKVVKITHKGKRVTGEGMIVGDQVVMKPATPSGGYLSSRRDYRKIGKAFSNEILALYASKKAKLEQFGLFDEPKAAAA